MYIQNRSNKINPCEQLCPPLLEEPSLPPVNPPVCRLIYSLLPYFPPLPTGLRRRFTHGRSKPWIGSEISDTHAVLSWRLPPMYSSMLLCATGRGYRSLAASHHNSGRLSNEMEDYTGLFAGGWKGTGGEGRRRSGATAKGSIVLKGSDRVYSRTRLSLSV